jgi:hypothetical protein
LQNAFFETMPFAGMLASRNPKIRRVFDSTAMITETGLYLV